jgi:UDP-N-acetyl-D-galactosamine dehydrogenase
MKNLISVVGLGYVGLPLAIEFGKKLNVIGFDINKERIQELNNGIDKYNLLKIPKNYSSKIFFTNKILDIFQSNYLIITLPTPVNKKNVPDLNNIKNLCKTIGQNIKKKTFIIFESTLYPGACKKIFLPILQKHSKLKYLKDYWIGYSPERINVGDKKNNLKSITKIVSGDCPFSENKIYNLYKKIMGKNLYLAESVEVAEAAKVFENTQRDVNISLMNEFSIICNKLKISSYNVIKAASTKWNFLKFYPGLVGGHCISVDPYYLSYCAKKAGHNPILINAGRKINNSMSSILIKKINYFFRNKKKVKRKIIVFGVAFKENCPDIRNSKIFDVINSIRKNFDVFLHDPYALNNDVSKEYGYSLKKFSDLPVKADVVIINLKHNYYLKKSYKRKIIALLRPGALMLDLKNLYADNEFKVKDRFEVFNL